MEHRWLTVGYSVAELRHKDVGNCWLIHAMVNCWLTGLVKLQTKEAVG